MKGKIFTAIASVIASATLLSACSTAYNISFYAYFQDNYNISPAICVEELKYTMSLEDAGEYNGYTVAYSQGECTMKLTRDSNDVYTLVTTQTASVTYTLNGSTTDPLQDSVQSTVVFKSAKNGLDPISSERRFISHSPVNTTPVTVNDCYKKYDRTVVTNYTYTEEGTTGTTTITDNMKTENNVSTSTFTVDEKKYTYLDNEQLLFALRCMVPSTTTKVQVYAPFSKATQRMKTYFAGSTTAKDFDGIEIDGKTMKREISYYPVTVQIDARRSGTAKTVWVAATTSATSNTYRNVVLRYENPLPYNLGTLTYQLVKADFTDKA